MPLSHALPGLRLPARPRRSGARLGIILACCAWAAPSAGEPTCDRAGGSCHRDAGAAANETMEVLLDRGYVIFRGAVPQEKVQRAIAAMEWPRSHSGTAPGSAQRVEEILELDPVFAELIDELPEDVVKIADEMLSPFWQLGSYHGHVLFPEDHVLNSTELTAKEKFAMHSDFPYGHATVEFGGSLVSLPRDFPYTLQLIWLLSPFTPENGCTLMVPGSHRNRTMLTDRLDEDTYSNFKANSVQILGQPGDLVLYIGQTFHIWGVNQADRKRMAILGQVLPFFFKHMESHVQKTPARVARQFPPGARVRLGLAPETWFGHPKRLLPFPRSLLEGLECLLDMLLFGYSGRMDFNVLFKHPLAEKFLPREYQPFVASAALAFFQVNRWSAICFLLGPFVLWGCARFRLCCCCRRCGCCGVETLALAAKASGLLLLGMALGVTLLLDRLHI